MVRAGLAVMRACLLMLRRRLLTSTMNTVVVRSKVMHIRLVDSRATATFLA